MLSFRSPSSYSPLLGNHAHHAQHHAQPASFSSLSCLRILVLVLTSLFVVTFVMSWVLLNSIPRESHVEDFIHSCNVALQQSSTDSHSHTNEDDDGQRVSNDNLFNQVKEIKATVVSAISNLNAVKETILKEDKCAGCERTAADKHSVSIPSSPSGKIPFLIIAIPTVSRTSGVNYLSKTLQALASQLPLSDLDPLYESIHIYVMNNNSPDHGFNQEFEDAKRHYSNSTVFFFFENPQTLNDETPDKKDPGTANEPGYRVRKQTRDIVALMQVAFDRSRLYLFMEDDFTLCPSGFRMIHYMVDKATSVSPDWFSLRLSFGMNGFIMRNGADLRAFAEYLLDRQRARPPDHLLTEFSAGETQRAHAIKDGRKHFVFRYNLFEHLGKISSLRPEQQVGYAPCLHEMNTEVVFEVESFRLNECPWDDVWPCRELNDPLRRPNFNLDDELIKQTQLK